MVPSSSSSTLRSVLLLVSFFVRLPQVVHGQMIGDEVTGIEGWVMDRFCIDRGTLFDNPSIDTLEGPDQHSVHCLIDVPQCIGTPFEILLDGAWNGPATRGYVLDEESKTAVVGLAKAVGVCGDCSGQGTVQTGFRARMDATIVEMADWDLGSGPVISARNMEAVLPDGSTVPFDPTMLTPPTEAPTEAPGPVTAAPGMNNVHAFNGGLTLMYDILTDEATGIQSFSAMVVYEGQGWVGFGFSPNPATMVGSLAIIGLPDEPTSSSNPGKYNLGAKDVNQVLLADQQTLTDASIVQNDTHTVLSFTKLLEEPGELAIDPTGPNNFIAAAGSSNTLNYHAVRDYVTFDLATGAVAAPASPSTVEDPAPAPAPATAAPGQGNFHAFNDVLTLSWEIGVDEATGAGTFNGRVEYEGQGWVGFGISPTGGMIGSLAVIGLPDEPVSESNPGKYNLNQQSVPGVQLASEQTLLNSNIEQNDTHTTLTFTKFLVETDEIEISPTGDNFFLAAAGSSNTLAQHSIRETAILNLASGGATSISLPTKESSFKAHGFLMAIAWGILVPLAISNSLLRHLIPGEGIWFQAHRALNVMALIMTIVGFALVVNALEESRVDPLHFESTSGALGKHKTIGLAVFILTFLQALGGLARPHLPEKDEDGKPKGSKSTIRTMWEVVHRGCGFALLAMAWYQCHSGIVLYANLFLKGDSDKYTNAFWGVVGTIAAIAFLGRLSAFFMPSSNPPAPSARKSATDVRV